MDSNASLTWSSSVRRSLDEAQFAFAETERAYRSDPTDPGTDDRGSSHQSGSDITGLWSLSRMAHQTVRNGPVAFQERQNNGVFEGVSYFGTDLATLSSVPVAPGCLRFSRKGQGCRADRRGINPALDLRRRQRSRWPAGLALGWPAHF